MTSPSTNLSGADRRPPAEKVFGLLLLALLLIVISIPPLIDPSESRYATIAQRMVLSGNWLVPEIDRGEGFMPFWGKPPLHIWLIALSMTIFGFSEFAARLPSLICLIATLVLCAIYARRCLSPSCARIFSFVAPSFPFLLLCGLASIVDASFSLWVTLAVVSFILTARRGNERFWPYLFFVALACGFMTKGPLMFALVGITCGGWVTLNKRWRVLRNFPWIRGAAITFILTLPWFIAAEQASPGLLHYFFMNENVQRYTAERYVDLYGSNHSTFRGVIAGYFLVIIAPLILFLLRRPIWRRDGRGLKTRNEQDSLLVIWALAPVLLFLPSDNVLITYLLPGIPAVLLFFSEQLARRSSAARAILLQRAKVLLFTSVIGGACYLLLTAAAVPVLIGPSIMLIVLLLFLRSSMSMALHGATLALFQMVTTVSLLVLLAPWLEDSLSTKRLVRSLDQDKKEALTFLDKVPYSALFYLQADPDRRSQLPLKSNANNAIPGEFALRRDKIHRLTTEQLRLLESESGTAKWMVLESENDDDVTPGS